MASGLVEVRFDEKQLDRVKAVLGNMAWSMPKVIRNALNRTAQKAHTEVVRGLSAESGLKQTDVRKATRVDKATLNYWQAAVHIFGRRIPLIKFRAKEGKTGVSYITNKESGRQTLDHSFIATMPKSNHKDVYLRTTKKRLPIKQQYGPSPGELFNSAASLSAKIISQVYKDLERNIDQQISWVLKTGRKAG